MKDFALFFIIQFVQYFLITVNYRAVAKAYYVWTFASDLAIAANTFFIIKRIGESKGHAAFMGYTLGGAFGSLLAIYITKVLYGS
jgi:hypothetical protein